MRRRKPLLSVFLVFILAFQSMTFALPSSAFAVSWPFGDGQGAEATTTVDQGAGKLVAEISPTAAFADFSESLTKGPGFKFVNAENDFVDFRLKGGLPVAPLKLGDLTFFDLPGGVKLKYTTTIRQIKEEIILDQAPTGNLVSFDFSSSSLVAEKGEEGGYELSSGGGGLAFAISPPVVWDTQGKTGAAELTIEKGVASIRIDDDFLKTATYPITVDPTVVASSAGGGSGINTQHNSFYDGARYWVLYSDNTNLVAKSSTDGVNWVADSSTIASGSSGIRLSTWYAGSGQVYAAYVSGSDILAKSGTISGTNITWSSASTVFSGTPGSDTYAYPSIARDSNGKLWVSARYYNGSDYRARAKRSTNPDNVTGWDASFDVSDPSSSQYIYPQAVTLAEGKMYFIYTYNSPSMGIIGRYFNGASWDSTANIANMNGISESRSPAAVVKNGVIHVGYLNGSNQLRYKTLASPYTVWSGEQTLADDIGYNIAFSLDDVSNDIYAFYTSYIGYTGKQLRQVKLGSPKRKTLLSDILTPFPKVEAIDASGSVRDVTVEAANSASSDVYNRSGFLVNAANDEFVVYSAQKPENVNIQLSQTDTGQGTTLTAEYRAAGGWSQFPGGAFTDATNKLRYNSGDLGIVPQTDWIRDSKGYYALKVRAQNSPTTKPIGRQIVPYQDMSQVSAPYTTSGDPFAIWREGRNSSFRVLFSTLRSQEKRGLESHYPTYAKDLKPARANVNLANGNLVLAVDGPATPARGVPTNPILTYNSQNPDDGPLGPGWTANIFSRLYVGWTDSSVLYQDNDGGRHLFSYNTGIYDGPPELHLTLTKAGSDFKLKTKDQITYTFDSSGTVKSVGDRNGNISNYVYDTENKLAKITDASSRDTSLTWDEDVNRLTKITDPAGRSMFLSYDTTGDLRTITDMAGKTTNLTYNSAHNLTGFTNALSNTTSFSYTNGKLATITDPAPLNYQTKFTYNRTSTEVDGPRTDLNDKTVYNIDPSGLLTSVVEPSQYLLSDGSQWRWRQKITLNTDSITLTAGSDPNLPHNFHISSDTAFNEAGSSKFWQKVDSTKGLVAFTAADGRTALSYAVKDWDFTGKDAFFDVKNTWDADSDTSMYVYYGYLAGGSYPKTATDFANAYDTNSKAIYSMNDDPNASTIQDFTINNNDGSKVAASNPNEIVGKAGKAENFDGVDDYVTVADNPSVSPTGAITLEAWIKTDTGQLGRGAITKGTAPGGYDYDYMLYFTGGAASPQTSFYFKNSAGTADFINVGNNYGDDQWHHYASVFDGNWMYLYIDGILRASKDTALTDIRDSGNLLRFGHGWDGAFKGSFDELRLSNVGRSADDIKLAYQSVNKQDDIGTVASNKYIEVAGAEDGSGVTSSVFDNDFNVTSTTKPDGATTSATYDASGNLTSQIDPLGHTTYFEYNGKNDITSTTDALGYNTKYSYDATGNLEKKINADNTSETYAPNAYGQNTKTTNARGYDTTYIYTSLGQTAKEIRSDDSSITHVYDLAGNEATTTDPLGKTTTHQYDLLGRETTSTDSLGNTTTYVYDAVGNRTSATNSRGKTTTYEYDQLNRLWRETKPTSATTTWQYDEAGNKAAETNPRGYATTFGHDALSRLSRTAYADGTTTTIAYDRVGNKVSEVNQKGAETAYAFDLAGRMTAKTDALNKTTTYAYDALGKETSSTNARGATTKYGYDALGRLTVTTDALENVTRDFYDAAGNKTKVVDARNNATNIGYDALNRVESTTDPLGHAVRYTYDAAGRKTSETNQIGHKTDFVYDDIGRLIRRVETNGPTTYFGYDAVGNNTTEAKSVEIPLADMEADESWAGGSFDTSNTKQANQSIKLTSTGGETSATKSITLDWATNYYPTTSTGGLQFWVYVDNADNLNTTATNDVILDSNDATLTHYYHYSLNGMSLVTGWNLIQIPRTSFVSVGSPTFSDIKRLIFKIAAKASTTVNVSLDDAKIVAASKITATRVFDDLDRVVFETDAKGATTGYTYDAAGNKLTVTDPAGKTSTFEYDSLNRETTTTDPLLHTTHNEYDEAGNKIAAIDAKGEVTTYDYDALNRQVGMEDPLGNYVESVYDAAGNKTAEVKESDNTTVTYGFDLANRMTSMTNELGQNTTYTLDAVGNQTGITPPQGAATTNIYDANNRLTTTTVAGQATTYAYDAAGNTTSETAPGNKTTTYRYNELGQTTSTVDPDGKVTSFTYDIRGAKLSQTESSLTIWYTYDETGREVKAIDSEGRIKKLTKDQKGRTTGSSDINGTVGFGYDDNDRLTSLKVAGETSNTFGYDNNGARTSYTQSNLVNTAFGYDEAGKLESLQTSTTAGTKLLDLSYQYIDESNIGTETISGNPQTFSYDDADQLISWKNTSGVDTSYAYDAAGNRTSAGADLFAYETSTSQLKTYTKDVPPNVDYQASALPATSTPAWTRTFSGSPGESASGSILTTSGTGTSMQTYKQSAGDLANSIGSTFETRFKMGTTGGSRDVVAFLDDGTKRAELTIQPGRVWLGIDYFSMNPADNYHVYRITLYQSTAKLYVDGTLRIANNAENSYGGSSAKTVQFGDVDDLSASHTEYWDYVKYWTTGAFNTIDYGYDLNGNLTSVSNTSDTTTYIWTGNNRLSSISSSSTSATFAYDAEGKRTAKTINGVTTKFVYDDIKLIAEKDASGNVTAKYFYDDSGRLISMKKNGQTYYFHLNHRGDVIKITDGSQTVVATYSYDPWGNILSSSGSFADDQPFRYASYYWDSETGLYYLINRYYDPTIGRFISKDPVSDPEDFDLDPAEANPYVYAANNPVMVTDPDGLNPMLKPGDSDATYVPLVKGMLINIAKYVAGEANYNAMITNNTGAYFGPGLEKAVNAFKTARGLVANGKVGNAVWQLLYAWNSKASASVSVVDAPASQAMGSASMASPDLGATQPGFYLTPVRATFNRYRFKVWHSNGTLWKDWRAESGVRLGGRWSSYKTWNQAASDEGPTPEGIWRIFASQWSNANDAASWGPNRWPLNPVNGTNTRGRTAMFLHGGLNFGYGTLGCLRIRNGATNWIKNLLPQLKDSMMDIVINYS